MSGAREVFGVDVAAAYLRAYADRHGAHVALANVENLPFRGRFDVVAVSDVLEHVLSVPDALVSASIERLLPAAGS